MKTGTRYKRSVQGNSKSKKKKIAFGFATSTAILSFLMLFMGNILDLISTSLGFIIGVDAMPMYVVIVIMIMQLSNMFIFGFMYYNAGSTL